MKKPVKQVNYNFLVVRGVSDELRHRFKVACAKEGMTIKEAISKLMEAFCMKVEGGVK